MTDWYDPIIPSTDWGLSTIETLDDELGVPLQFEDEEVIHLELGEASSVTWTEISKPSTTWS